MAKKYLNLSQILKKLLFERNMRPVDLARELNMPTPTIHRIVTGKSTRPYKSSLDSIAKFLNVSIDQLTGDEPLFPSNIKDLEALSLNKYTKVIPHISWEALISDNKYLYYNSKLVVFNVSNNGFALTMADYSMEPLFKKNSILIFDPEVPAIDRSFILVKLFDQNIYLFRQLLIDGNKKFIKSLNPDTSSISMRSLDSKDEIIACLVESRNIFNTKYEFLT